MKNILMIVGLFVAILVVMLTSIISLQCSRREQTGATQAATQPTTQPVAASAPAATAAAPAVTMVDAAAKAHELLAIIALSDVKVLMARKEYDQATKLAQEALRQYVDTAMAADFQQLAEQAAGQAQAQKEAAAAQEAARSAESEAEFQARHDRFVAYRDQALAAYNAGDYPNAIVLLQNALKEEANADAQGMLDQAIARVSKPRIAVLDFTVTGDIGLANAGRAVAELLLTKIDPRAFQLVERSRLADLLAEQGLTVPQLGNNPQVLEGKGLAIVRFLVMGSIIRTENVVTIAGRLVDAQSGQVVNTAQVRVNSPAELQQAVGELAALLQMSPEQKAQYFQDKQQADQQAAQVQQRAADESWARHIQAAAAALNQVRGLLAAGDLYNAAMLSRQYASDYGDTPMARAFVDVLALAEAGMSQQGYRGGIIVVFGGGHGGDIRGRGDDHGGRDGHGGGPGGGGVTPPGGHGGGPAAGDDRAHRHEQFLQYQREGKVRMAAKDWSAAVAAFTRALTYEDDGDVRQLLRNCTQQKEQAQQRQTQYNDVMSKGGKAEAAGQWTLAMRYYEQAYALNHSDAAKEGLDRTRAKVNNTAAKEAPVLPRPAVEPSMPQPSQPNPARPPIGPPANKLTAEPSPAKPQVEPLTKPVVAPTVIKPPVTPPVTKPASPAEQGEEKPAEQVKPTRTVTKESILAPVSPPSPVGPPPKEPMPALPPSPAVQPPVGRPPIARPSVTSRQGDMLPKSVQDPPRDASSGKEGTARPPVASEPAKANPIR